MDISHLYEYVILAKHMQLTSAARELFLAPSTLSQHITTIEKELNTRLFDRKSMLVLTKDGEIALEHFQKILEEYELVKAKCLKSDEKETTIRVPSYFFGLGGYLTAKNVFQQQYPDYHIHFQTHEYQLKDPLDVLNDKLCDFAAMYIVRGTGESICDYLPSDMDYIHFVTSQTAVATSNKHPLADKPCLALDDFQNQILLATSCRLTEIYAEGIKRKFQQQGISIAVRYRRVNRHEDMFGLNMDDGLFIVSKEWRELQYFAEFPHIVVHELDFELLLDTYLLYKPTSLSKLQLMYVDTLRETAKAGLIPFS